VLALAVGVFVAESINYSFKGLRDYLNICAIILVVGNFVCLFLKTFLPSFLFWDWNGKEWIAIKVS